MNRLLVQLFFLLAATVLLSHISHGSGSGTSSRKDVCMGGPCLPKIKFEVSPSILRRSAEQVEEEAEKWGELLDEMAQGAENPCAEAAVERARDNLSCATKWAKLLELDTYAIQQMQDAVKEITGNFDERAKERYDACRKGRSAALESARAAAEAVTGVEWEEVTGEKDTPEHVLGRLIKALGKKIFPEDPVLTPYRTGESIGENIPILKKLEMDLECADKAIEIEEGVQTYAQMDRDNRIRSIQQNIDQYENCLNGFYAMVEQYQRMMNDEACMEGVPASLQETVEIPLIEEDEESDAIVDDS